MKIYYKKWGKNVSRNTTGDPYRSPGELYHNVAHAVTDVGRSLHPAVRISRALVL